LDEYRNHYLQLLKTPFRWDAISCCENWRNWRGDDEQAWQRNAVGDMNALLLHRGAPADISARRVEHISSSAGLPFWMVGVTHAGQRWLLAETA